MKELQAHAEQNKLSIARVVMANEMAVSGKSEAEINAFIDKVSGAMVNIVKAGLKAPAATLPGPIKLKTKAGDVYTRAMDDKYERQRGVGVVAAYALAGSEENARGHLVVTAPTGGSAGVMPALVYALGEGGRRLPQDKIRDGFLAAAAVGYLCKHNATLSGAEGGCQAEIGVASAMGAAFIAQAHDFGHQVVANAAESSLQHHLGMTCDPVAGFVQVPCIERCAFGAVKAWTGFMNPQSILCGMIAGLLFIPTTIFDMVWGVRFLQEARGFDYASAVMRSSMVPLGWIIGCPLLGFISDSIGRRKPVIAAGAIAMFGCLAWILYGRTDLFPPYVLGLVAGIASGAAMLPYTVIKEANPPGMSGTATGVVNFINFTFSALLGPVFGWLLVRLSGGASELSLEHYQAAFHPMLYGVALAIVFTFLLKETGPAARASSVPLPVAQREAT
jgi:L-serine deaminase